MRDGHVHAVAGRQRMPLKRFALLALLVGCSKPGDKKPIHIDVSFPDATPTIPADSTPKEYVALAKTALDAVTTLVSKCELYRAGYDDAERITDSCGIWKAADVEALTKARKALDASPLAPDAGFGHSFATRIDAFDDMSSGLYKSEQGYWAESNRGTIARYQELAMTWNDWRPPADAVPVDVGGQKNVKVAPGPSGHLEWTKCSYGPCILLPKSDKKANR